jgi:hypothetical protein
VHFDEAIICMRERLSRESCLFRARSASSFSHQHLLTHDLAHAPASTLSIGKMAPDFATVPLNATVESVCGGMGATQLERIVGLALW